MICGFILAPNTTLLNERFITFDNHNRNKDESGFDWDITGIEKKNT